VVVSGPGGFIGRGVPGGRFVDPELQVTVLGRRDTADIRFDLAAGSPGALARFLDAVMPRVVVNCAGATYGTPRDLVRANTQAVATVCEAIRRSHDPARLVHVGSAAEYGAVPIGTATPETAEPRPLGPYGVTKLAGTELALSSGLDAVVLRIFDVVGPGVPAGSLFGRLSEGAGTRLRPGAVKSRLFGCAVTVTGLVGGKDILEALQGVELGDLVLIPDVMLKEGEGVFLDDLTPEGLEAGELATLFLDDHQIIAETSERTELELGRSK